MVVRINATYIRMVAILVMINATVIRVNAILTRMVATCTRVNAIGTWVNVNLHCSTDEKRERLK